MLTGLTNTVNITGDNGLEVGNIGISSNVIATRAGGGNELFIDPYPDGLSNEGKVIIKGDLQVDGTTTTVNSTTSTLNDAIFHLGDVTSTRTVMAEHTSGTNVITLDSVVGINTGDGSLLHGSIPNNTSVTAYNTGTKVVTISKPQLLVLLQLNRLLSPMLTIVILIEVFLSRIIQVVELQITKMVSLVLMMTSIADSAADADNHGTHADDSRRWTYVPDATISNSLVTGTKGFLDIKGIYYQSGDFATGGVVFFDDTGLQRSTNAPAAPVITSKQILTAITKNTLTLGANITAATGDIIRQDSTGAYGVVESGVTNSSTVNLIGVEGTFNTSNNLRREGQSGAIANLASVPSAVAVIYTNKPPLDFNNGWGYILR